jgi:hypothetical protein
MNTGNVVARYKFFHVAKDGPHGNRKTADYHIVNNSSGLPIATIQWYGAWRQFCLFPYGDTIWSAGCLADVQDVITKLKGGKL